MDSLETYRAKRDFTRTSEPSGGKAAKSAAAAGGIFVVHKHAARRLHYDLRLEHDGVLWSWAVTRGPSLDPSEKRLAVHVEDHPLDYAAFEGTIPAGEYGAGAVIVWDEGTWAPEFDPAKGMRKGHLRFELKGQKLQGSWHLVRLKPRPGERGENWLLIKSSDEAARPGEDILAEAPQSVKTGRTIEDIEQGRTASKKPAKKMAAPPAPAKDGRKSGGAMPGFVEPCLATLHASPPAGAQWLHEVKFDGYRLQAHMADGKVRLLTRSGLDWTHRFRGIVTAFGRLACDQALVDGEVVVLTDGGLSSFPALQQALSENRTEKMVFYAFDLLFLDGEDLRGEPLAERKERLAALLGEDEGNAPLRYSEHFAEPGEIMLKHACRLGLEGVVSKRADAPYRSGRNGDWVKSKCTLRQEFVIAGYLPSDKIGRGLRSLVMGYHEDGRLKPAGHVGTGFSQGVMRDLKARLDAIRTEQSPFEGAAAREKKVVWVKPELVAEIEYRSMTADNILRHASFQGLREDKPAEEVVAEIPEDAKDARKPRKRRNAAVGKSRERAVTSIVLSNADKVLWPDTGNTKQDLLDHYARVWDRMERFVVNRPLSLVRAPDGVGRQRFFQKHASKGMSDAIHVLKDPQDGEDLLYVEDFDGIAALVQMGVVEIHVWGSSNAALEQPDNIVFDLDPDEGLDVEDVRAAAFDVKKRLEELGMTPLVKVSGGKGFHVVVPLKPKADWATVKEFTHDFARAMEQANPEKYTATLSKKARKGRIFIDYLRNGRGATAIAPWSSRGKPKATVAVPVTWDEVAGTLGPADFSLGSRTLDEALNKPDPWADFGKHRATIKG